MKMMVAHGVIQFCIGVMNMTVFFCENGEEIDFKGIESRRQQGIRPQFFSAGLASCANRSPVLSCVSPSSQ
jgi:hypothetical protein